MNYQNDLKIPSESKAYLNKVLQEFSNLFENDKVDFIHYGKEDLRGSFSITLHFKDHTTNGVGYFRTSIELLSYVEGVLHYKRKSINYINY